MQSAAILVVDDEPPILDLIASYLRADGFVVHTAKDGPSALAQARAIRPDLIVLDVMLPGMDGLEVCRRIQQEFDVYVLMLTARTEEIDKIVGLSVGADDYLTKPFSLRELLARVRAQLRRMELLRTAETATTGPLNLGVLRIDPLARRVQLGDELLDLTVKEYELLLLLARHPGRSFSRAYLLDHIWGDDYEGGDRTVDTHVVRLRRKLGEMGERIATVWGVGYRFE